MGRLATQQLHVERSSSSITKSGFAASTSDDDAPQQCWCMCVCVNIVCPKTGRKLCGSNTNAASAESQQKEPDAKTAVPWGSKTNPETKERSVTQPRLVSIKQRRKDTQIAEGMGETEREQKCRKHDTDEEWS